MYWTFRRHYKVGVFIIYERGNLKPKIKKKKKNICELNVGIKFIKVERGMSGCLTELFK